MHNTSGRRDLGRWCHAVLRAAVAASATGTAMNLYASWNGATQVSSWQVLAGRTPNQLSKVVTAPRSGFETAIAVPGNYQSFKVQALDSSGRVIGTSRPFRSGT